MDMISKAKARYIKGSPQKARLVADMVRGKCVSDALPILKFSKRRASKDIEKVLMSAVANARTQSPDIDIDKLLINRIFVDCAPIAYRWRARAMGRADRIRKRYSHITVELAENGKE